LDIRLAFEQLAQPEPDDLMVVEQEHRDRHRIPLVLFLSLNRRR
jgi:hypothetical protein